MDFKPLTPLVIAKSVPTIKANANTVVIGIPNHIADLAGLNASSRVELGLASKAKQSFLSIAPKADSYWSMTQRAKTRQIFAGELRPKTAPSKAIGLVYRVEGGRLILTLPDGWDLKRYRRLDGQPLRISSTCSRLNSCGSSQSPSGGST